jgi:DNA repair protein RadC
MCIKMREILGIKVLDYILVGHKFYYSFFEENKNFKI